MALQLTYDDREMNKLANQAGIYTRPHPDDPRTCAHAWGFQLDPKVIPAWLIDAIGGQVSAPEVPGAPQICRCDEYVDWLALAASRPGEFRLVEDNCPTIRSLEVVEDLRTRGHDARIEAEVYIVRQKARPRLPFRSRRKTHRLIFGVQAAAVSIYRSHDAMSVLEKYQQDLTKAARALPASHPGDLPIYTILDYDSGHGFATLYFTT